MVAVPFNNLITFSRGSNATVTGSNGLIQWAPNNLLTFSEQFDNAAWTKNNVTITANSTVAPDGTATADTITATATTASHNVTQAGGLSGVQQTFSIYAKAGTSSFIQLWHGAGASIFANFNLATGAIGTVGALATAAIASAGNGWYRCTITCTPGSTNQFRVAMVTSDTAVYTESWTATGTETCIAWGAQLELGSTATTYNPTTVKNLLGFSEAFDNAGWTKNAASIVTGAQANPVNGLFNAQKLMEDTANAQHRVSQSVTLAAAPHTLSAYLKAGERSWVLMVNGTIANCFTYFNLSTGVVGSVGAGVTSASITAVGGGWYRCAITFTAPAGGNAFEFRTASANGTGSYTGDGNSGVYIYGAQLSDSASLDPYVPTPGAAPSSTAFYGPRFDFDPVTLQPRGLLVEEQRTNLATYSDQFDNAIWTKVNATITANNAVAPDGTTTADLVTVTGASGRVVGSHTFTAAAQTLSVYSKFSSQTETLLRIFDGTNTFTLTLSWSGGVPAFVSNTGSAYTISNAGNGWYRISMTATTLAASGTVQIFANGFGSSGAALLWGAQLEAGAFATSYIPTVASTVTRSADVATITGQNFAQWYRQDEGAFVVQATSAIVDTTTRSVATVLNSGTPANCMRVILTLQRQFNVSNSGATQADLDGGDPTSGAITKIGAAYAVNNFALSLNGGTVVTDTTGTVPTVNTLTFGANEFDASRLNGHIRSIRFIPARAADFQLQALST